MGRKVRLYIYMIKIRTDSEWAAEYFGGYPDGWGIWIIEAKDEEDVDIIVTTCKDRQVWCAVER